MVALIDANVIINYMTGRTDPMLDESIDIIERGIDGEYDGYAAFHTVSVLWYLLRGIPEDERRIHLKDFFTYFTVCSASHDDVLSALDSREYHDLEDCLQSKCAENINADYIVTCNIKDYRLSSVPAVTPAEFKVILDGKRRF